VEDRVEERRVKALGVSWDLTTDDICFDFVEGIEEVTTVTK
jgi:hypothetical protein